LNRVTSSTLTMPEEKSFAENLSAPRGNPNLYRRL
jgi:hypothetical protein